METKKDELKKWLSNFCANELHVEKELRKLILLDKNLVSMINEVYNDNHNENNVVFQIEFLIRNFINNNNILMRKCNYCNINVNTNMYTFACLRMYKITHFLS